MGINKVALEKNYFKVLAQMKNFKLDLLLESPGHANLSIVQEL